MQGREEKKGRGRRIVILNLKKKGSKSLGISKKKEG